MQLPIGVQKFPQIETFLKVGEAAQFLGVTTKTLRNWDHTGKLPAHRHPVNGYRMYNRDDLEKFLRSCFQSSTFTE